MRFLTIGAVAGQCWLESNAELIVEAAGRI